MKSRNECCNLSIGLYIALAPLSLNYAGKLQEKRFDFIKTLANIISENLVEVSKIKYFKPNQQTLHRRDRIASLQKILLQAAQEGDFYASVAYEQAAKELYDIIYGVKKKIFDGRKCMVSCSGGIFKVGDVIMNPFVKLLEANGMELTVPKAEPYVGAVLLARCYYNEQLADNRFN